MGNIVRQSRRREGVVQLGTFESDGGSQVMSRPSQSATGAFFGIIASALILVLTAMALTTPDRPRPERQMAQVEVTEATPTGLSLEALRNGNASASR